MTIREATILIIAEAILSTLKESNSLFGVPGGHLYDAVMGHIDLGTFQTIMGSLVKAGKVTQKGQCYFPVTLVG